EKLAAMEWHFETEESADLVLFGMLDEETQEVKYEFRVPGFLSFLAGTSFDTEVTGLDDIPEDEHPPLVIHYFFDIMVFFGSRKNSLRWSGILKLRRVRTSSSSACWMRRPRK